MNSLPEHFAKLLSNLQPKGGRVELAQNIPGELREYLKDTDKIQTVYPHTRLSGSYSRNTAIKKIKDVDILLFVSDSYRDGEECIRQVINDLVNALRDFPEYLQAENGSVDAELALRRQRRSVQVHVTVNGEEFDIDVVPSIADGKLDDTFLVPDRDLSKWIESNPLGYNKALSQLNQDRLEKIVPLIKLFKHWRDVQMIRMKPKSYWLECLIYKYAKDDRLNIIDSSYGELFFSLLEAIYTDFKDKWLNEDNSVPVIKDPKLGNNVAKSWSREEFEAFMRRIDESKKIANNALNAEDKDKAIELWQRLFNEDDDSEEYFPSVVDETLAAALSGKSLFVESSGIVTGQKSITEKSWSSPAHKFYGE